MVDVVHEGVERTDALLDASRQAAPFVGGDHARDDVERDEAFGGRGVAVDGEGDARAPEQAFGVAAFGAEGLERLVCHPVCNA